MISRDAIRIIRASIFLANWSTDSVQPIAGFVICAILVVMAHCGNAGDSWVALGTSWTDALRPVRDRDTFCATTARDISNQARGDTIVAQTGLVVRTIAI